MTLRKIKNDEVSSALSEALRLHKASYDYCHMDITIRPARSEDIPGMCELLEELFSLESDFEPDIEKQVKGLVMLLNEPGGKSLVLVAVSQGLVVGMATVQTLVSTAEGGRVGLVEDVMVDRTFRGQGVGTLLLEQIKEWARSRNLKRLQLLADRGNRAALSFYASRKWSATNLMCVRTML